MRYLALLIILTACGTASSSFEPEALDSTPTSQVSIIMDAETKDLAASALVSTIETTDPPMVAEATMTAVRVDPPDPPPDPCQVTQSVVDTLPYEWSNMEPVRTAYRMVAMNCLGWDQVTTDKWERFIVDDVIRKESGGCWNILRRAIMDVWLGCVHHYPKAGPASDAGFFQIVGSNYAPGTWLCEEHGICSRGNIIDTPYNSMKAGLLFVMHDGRGPWSYNADAKRYHPLWWTVPRYWP